MPTKNAFLKRFKNATSNNEFFKFDVAFIPPKGRGWALVGLSCRVGKLKRRKGCELNQIRAIAAITYLPTYLPTACYLQKCGKNLQGHLFDPLAFDRCCR